MNQIYQMVWKKKALKKNFNVNVDADPDANTDAWGSAIALPGFCPGELKINSKCVSSLLLYLLQSKDLSIIPNCVQAFFI